MHIIPAIDIINGKCVRLTKGDYNTQKVYNENPLEVAKQFEDIGIKKLHLVDLDGAKAKHIVNKDVLELIASKTNLEVDFGGGIKSEEDVKIALESGAKQVTVGSLSAKEPNTVLSILEKYGNEKIILGADALKGKIAVNGWQENTELEVMEFIYHYRSKGIEYVICTDIDKDGMLQGPSFDLYQKIMDENSGIHLIASGGVSNMNDLIRLSKMDIHGAIVGKAIYEQRISLKELRYFQLGVSS